MSDNLHWGENTFLGIDDEACLAQNVLDEGQTSLGSCLVVTQNQQIVEVVEGSNALAAPKD